MAANPMPKPPLYPFKKYNYRVEIDSIDVPAFAEISGCDASVEVLEYREGSDPINSPRKLPGMTKYGNVTLRWGMSENKAFYEWVFGIVDGSRGTPDQRVQDVTIYLRGDNPSAKEDLASWTLVNAWPCKYTGPDFNASASEIAFESVERAFEEMRRNL